MSSPDRKSHSNDSRIWHISAWSDSGLTWLSLTKYFIKVALLCLCKSKRQGWMLRSTGIDLKLLESRFPRTASFIRSIICCPIAHWLLMFDDRTISPSFLLSSRSVAWGQPRSAWGLISYSCKGKLLFPHTYMCILSSCHISSILPSIRPYTSHDSSGLPAATPSEAVSFCFFFFLSPLTFDVLLDGCLYRSECESTYYVLLGFYTWQIWHQSLPDAASDDAALSSEPPGGPAKNCSYTSPRLR